MLKKAEKKEEPKEKKIAGEQEEELTEEKKRNEELTETLQWLQAEFENYKKRIEKEKFELVDFGKAELVYELLPVLESIDSALEQLRKNGNQKNPEFIKGVELIRKKFWGVLEKEGLEEIECMGKELDPLCHDVLFSEEDKSKKEGIVLEELQKGFLFNGKVLRHSKVKVNKFKEEEIKGGKENESKGKEGCKIC